MIELVAELATGHGGDVGLAEAMMAAAAEAGANTVKIQSYSLAKLNPRDPQAAWLTQAHLDRAAHVRLMATAKQAGVQFLSTPFDADSLTMLRELGCYRYKIASTEAHRSWWRRTGKFIVSWPWGNMERISYGPINDDLSNVWIVDRHLTAIPLYPTPLECVSRATLLEGWSDHCIGIAACQRAIVLGATLVEVHFTASGSRRMPFDKTYEQVRQLREFADAIETMTTGVSQTFRERWTA